MIENIIAAIICIILIVLSSIAIYRTSGKYWSIELLCVSIVYFIVCIVEILASLNAFYLS